MAEIEVIKMHGLGNDYIYVDGLRRPLPDMDWGAFARAVSPRHTAVGSDGVILILPPDGVPGVAGADAAMRMFNADGSEGEMCGNGVRCLAWYVRDRGHVDKREMVIATPAGPIGVTVDGPGSVTVDMGRPRFGDPSLPPVDGEGGLPLITSAGPLTVWPVSMGNPHAVIFSRAIEPEWRRAGREIECNPAFPNRTNVEFVDVTSRKHLDVRVWERGSGPTMACGTGAAAAMVISARRGLVDDRVTVTLPGGDLEVQWSPGSPVLLTGPVAEAFRGSLSWPGAE